jgi:ethanolamine utilization protein EutP (predicted NTPase)
MLWCKAGIVTARVGLDTRQISYTDQVLKENAGEYLQRDMQKYLITHLEEIVAAISKHAPDDAATLPEGLTDTLANMRQDDAAPRTHLTQLSDISTAVRDLLVRLEPGAPDVPAPD